MNCIVVLYLLAATEPVCDANSSLREVAISDGSVSKSCTDPMGFPEGPMWNIGRDGEIRWIERYKRGRPHGEWVRFWTPGRVSERRHYVDGRLHGRWKRWSHQGRIRLEGRMEAGKKHGEFRAWTNGGEVSFEAKFRRGKPDGVWKIYRHPGMLVAECRYESGQSMASDIRVAQEFLERADVVERLTAVRQRVTLCYERELARWPELSGRADYRFVVTPVGLTAGVRLQSSALENSHLHACVSDVIEQTRFPTLATCELVDIEFPFVMSGH